jgi:hypothetical protein
MARMSQPADSTPEAIHLRTDLRPGDVGKIVTLHGVIYSREQGFDPTFEAYVAGPLAEFVRAGSSRERLWIAEPEAAGRVQGPRRQRPHAAHLQEEEGAGRTSPCDQKEEEP